MIFLIIKDHVDSRRQLNLEETIVQIALNYIAKIFLDDDEDVDDDDDDDYQDKINANSLFEGPWTSSSACDISFKCESPPSHNDISVLKVQ